MNSTEDQHAAIGSRLRWAREQAGLSQGQVGRTLEMHRPTISEIEAGRRTVKATEVTQFSDLYDIKEDWILRGDDALESADDPRIKVAARELSKLNSDDLDTILRVVRVLRTN